MSDFANLLDAYDAPEDKGESVEQDADHDLDGEDSGTEVFDSAAEEAFQAVKEGDVKAFAKALRLAIGAR